MKMRLRGRHGLDSVREVMSAREDGEWWEVSAVRVTTIPEDAARGFLAHVVLRLLQCARRFAPPQKSIFHFRFPPSSHLLSFPFATFFQTSSLHCTRIQPLFFFFCVSVLTHCHSAVPFRFDFPCSEIHPPSHPSPIPLTCPLLLPSMHHVHHVVYFQLHFVSFFDLRFNHFYVGWLLVPFFIM